MDDISTRKTKELPQDNIYRKSSRTLANIGNADWLTSSTY